MCVRFLSKFYFLWSLCLLPALVKLIFWAVFDRAMTAIELCNTFLGKFDISFVLDSINTLLEKWITGRCED